MNLADAHRRNDPANVAWQRYDFLDQNQNGLYDGAQELGVLRTESGATGTALRTVGTPVNPDLATEFVDELSFSLEHEVVTDTSLRFSYVHKSLNGDSGQWNIAANGAPRRPRHSLRRRHLPLSHECAHRRALEPRARSG